MLTMTGRAGLGTHASLADGVPSNDLGSTLTVAEFEQAVRATDPDAFLVEPRIMRRVLRQDHNVGLLGRHAVGRGSYAVDGVRSLTFLDRDELGDPIRTDLPETLILIARPEPGELMRQSASKTLLSIWRLVFHARVQATMKRRVVEGRLSRSEIHRRVDRIGQPEFDEIRAVLRQEHYIQDSRDPIQTYVEFAALYAELRHFAPAMLPRFFPSLGDSTRIDAILADDLDVDALLARYRPVGAPELPKHREIAEDDDDPNSDADVEVDSDLEPWIRTRWPYRLQIRRADRVAARGNHVRAAIRRTRAARYAPPVLAETTRESARRELGSLARQLGPALRLDATEISQWSRALPPLLGRAGKGIWSHEARLLYDLQKVVVDHDREIYTVDLVEWALSLGRRPIKRTLPFHREVLIVQHLISARRRLAKVRLPEPDRDRLSALLRSAVDRAKRDLREVFRPVVSQTLEATGWIPANVPEQAALEKLTEELLDRVVDRGFLNMSDLRDAVSRSNLKLPDLSGVAEFWHGDRLLRTDRALAIRIDGVYRRGEVYLRWLQRVSSLAFGTGFGRAVTLYAILPFGGAFVLLSGLDHLVHPLMHFFRHRMYFHFFNPVFFLSLGMILLGMVNSLKFRTRFAQAVRHAALGLRWAWRTSHPDPGTPDDSSDRRKSALHRVDALGLQTAAPRDADARDLDVPSRGPRRRDSPEWGRVHRGRPAAELAGGRDAEEILADRAVRLWYRVRRDLIPGLFRLVMETFDRLLETFERLLYAIDEWLRFKSGQGPLTLASKAVIGLVWFFVTYIVRFGVNLVTEPQVNPIKHFPMVTVAHKVLVPVIFAMSKAIQDAPLYLHRDTAWTIAISLQFIIPGIVGFLVWEFKENWKLYEANRSRDLRPVIVGHHGETIARLLRPGFHSGTIPKLFAKLRRAERKSILGSRRLPSPTRKFRESLHHVEEEVRHFIVRDFLALLDLSQSLSGGMVRLDSIHLGTNRIRVSLCHHDAPERPLVLAFEDQSGWLVAGVANPGWSRQLTSDQRETLRDALAGLYKFSGVDLVREQIEAQLGPERPSYDISDSGLIVWPDSGFETEVVIAFPSTTSAHAGRSPSSKMVHNEAPAFHRMLFSAIPLSWSRWVEVWERDRAQDGHPVASIPGVVILPETLRHCVRVDEVLPVIEPREH